MSIALILLFYKILLLSKININIRVLVLTIWMVFPRDIFASAMITNDYLLVFNTTLTIYFILIHFNSKLESKRWWFSFLCVTFFACLGGLIKQSGFVLLSLPFLICSRNIFLLESIKHKLVLITSILFGFLLSFSIELRNIIKYDNFLISNQDFFNYAADQLPKKFEAIEFYNLKIISLLNHPFLSEYTLYSFNTEIFARFWYDYERRFVQESTISLITARYAYSIGLFWIIFLGILLFRTNLLTIRLSPFSFHRYISLSTILFILFLSYYFVPFLQTLRFPHFSSMKAQFVLPAIPALLLLLSKLINGIKINTNIIFFIVFCNSIFLLLVLFSSYLGITHGINEMSGPLWIIP